MLPARLAIHTQQLTLYHFAQTITADDTHIFLQQQRALRFQVWMLTDSRCVACRRGSAVHKPGPSDSCAGRRNKLHNLVLATTHSHSASLAARWWRPALLRKRAHQPIRQGSSWGLCCTPDAATSTQPAAPLHLESGVLLASKGVVTISRACNRVHGIALVREP